MAHSSFFMSAYELNCFTISLLILISPFYSLDKDAKKQIAMIRGANLFQGGTIFEIGFKTQNG